MVKTEAKPGADPAKLIRCGKCNFLTYCKTFYNSHNCETTNIERINCPGCSNTFLSSESYKSHLKIDHRVRNEEIEQFLREQSSSNGNFLQPKSKIFIRDVQTLRKPDLPHSNASIPNIFDSLDLTTTEDDILDDFLACDDQIFDDEFEFDESVNLNNDDVVPEVEIIEQNQPKLDTNGDGQGKIFVRKNLCGDDAVSSVAFEAPTSKIFVRSHESLTNQIILTEEIQQPPVVSTPDCIIVSTEDVVSPEQTGKIFIRDIETLTSPSNDVYFQQNYQPSIYVRSLDSLANTSEDNQQRCKISIKNMETLIEPNLMQPPNLMNSTPLIFGQAQNLVIHIQPPQNEDNLLRYRDTSITPDTLPGSSNVSTCGGNDDVIMLEDHEISNINIANDNFVETPELLSLLTSSESFVNNPTDISEIVQNEVLVTPERNETPNDKNVLQKLEIQENLQNQPMVSIPMEFCASEEVVKETQEIKLKPSKKNKRKKVIRENSKSDSNIQIVYKCSQENCNEHFSSENLLNYHRKCHGTGNVIICPECRCEDFKTYTNLHTHLWRAHKVDIDLFSCELCDFKTPILSRLNNFHAKTHLDVKNYKCTFMKCEKSFKNSKQLANHVQIHKKRKIEKITSDEPSSKKLRCLECNKSFSSESGLYIHSMEHKNEEKKFNCTDCVYSTNDHNSFRRHKSQHSLVHHYKCPSCDYSSIQSNTYRKHLERQHPELAESLLFKCNMCKFTTISRAKYDGHLVKHCDIDEVENKKNAKMSSGQIKVKSNDLLLHDQAVHVIIKNLLPNQANDL